MADGDNRSGTASRDELIGQLVENLPALRAKVGLTQSDLADKIGIGRQTPLSIENKKGKMRWNTFLALVAFFSKNEATEEMMRFLHLHLDFIDLEH